MVRGCWGCSEGLHKKNQLMQKRKMDAITYEFRTPIASMFVDRTVEVAGRNNAV